MGGHKIVIQRRTFRGSDTYDEKGKEDNGQMRKHRGKHQFKGVYIKTRGVFVCVHRQAYITSGYLDLQLCLLVLLMFSSAQVNLFACQVFDVARTNLENLSVPATH